MAVAALLILALVPFSNAMPLAGLPDGVMVGNLKGIYSDPFEVMPMLKRGKVLASDSQESRSVLKIFIIVKMQFTLADNCRRTLHTRPKRVRGEA